MYKKYEALADFIGESMIKLRKKWGIILMIIGIAFQFLNILTYGLWEIDIDIIGALIFIVGLVMFIISLIKRK